MSVKKGSRMGGIYSTEDLRQRTTLDEVTGCWEWKGARTAGGNPSFWVGGVQAVGSMGTLLSVLTTGKRPVDGMCWVPICRNRTCVNPAHYKHCTRGEANAHMRPKLTPMHRARIAAGMRKASKICTQEIADAIRGSDELLTVLAARHNLSISMVSLIRRGELWAPTSPWRLAA